MKPKFHIILSVALALAFVSCAKKDDAQKAAEQAAASASAPGATATTTAASNEAPGKAIPSSSLVKFLPDISGYTAGEPEHMDMNMSGVAYSSASRTYKNGDKEIKVTFWDYNHIANLSAAYKMFLTDGFNMETQDELMRYERIQGQPGWINWNKKNNSGTIGIVANDRIYIIIEGEDGVTLDDLKDVGNKIDVSGVSKAS